MIEITEEIKQQIYDLYDECLENLSQFHRKVDLFVIPAELAAIILKETNIDVAGYWVCIDNYGITLSKNTEIQFRRLNVAKLHLKEKTL